MELIFSVKFQFFLVDISKKDDSTVQIHNDKYLRCYMAMSENVHVRE